MKTNVRRRRKDVPNNINPVLEANAITFEDQPTLNQKALERNQLMAYKRDRGGEPNEFPSKTKEV